MKPNPNTIFPVPGIKTVTYVKPTIQSKNIIVGDFTYFSDTDFEKHVTHHYDFCNDRLIIGKFCQIAAGVEFIMNGANHPMNGVSTFPFYIFEGWEQDVPALEKMPLKGDTIIGNDVWIGQNATILPGVHIGDGAVIGANSVVASNVDPYSIVAGNPARLLRKRFDDELITEKPNISIVSVPQNFKPLFLSVFCQTIRPVYVRIANSQSQFQIR